MFQESLLNYASKNSKEARNKRIFDLWLSCHTQEEIGEKENLSQPQIKEVLSEMAILQKSMKPAADHITGFTLPIYNIWKFQQPYTLCLNGTRLKLDPLVAF